MITGFVNALAILIFMAQLPQLTGDAFTWQTYAMVAAGLAIIYGLPRLTTLVPSPLAAIVVLAGLSIAFKVDVFTVGDMGELPDSLPWLHIPQIPITWETLRIIAPYSLAMAAVGLLESLLTASIVDDLTETRSDKKRETYGQGIANFVTGWIGGMGGCAMIGQSVINIKSGGRRRLSTFVAGVMLLVLIVGLGHVGCANPDAGAGRGDDLCVDQHLPLEKLYRNYPSPMAVQCRDDRDRGDGRGDP